MQFNDKRKANLWGNLWQILNQVHKLLEDYEKLQNDHVLQKKLPQMESAYIDSIIVHTAKIFSTSVKNEEFRLQAFKDICKAEIKQKLQKIEDKHKDTIEKIQTNRNKLIAHLDKNFYKLCFSRTEIQRMETDWVTRMHISPEEAKRVSEKFKRTDYKNQERYSIGDFREDFPEIKTMTDELMCIWFESNPLV